MDKKPGRKTKRARDPELAKRLWQLSEDLAAKTG